MSRVYAPCSVRGCGRPRELRAPGRSEPGRTRPSWYLNSPWCPGHRKRFDRYGDVRAHVPLRAYVRKAAA